MNEKKILVVGGARSGKSEFAENLCLNLTGKRTYLATAIPFDQEMKKRIQQHKKRRNSSFWHDLIEEPYNLPAKLLEIETDILLVDCITIWLSNLLLKNTDEKFLNSQINLLIDSLKKINYNIVLVSNEVGMSIVPENKLARIFRDISGFANKKIAETVNEFYIIFSGYPLKLK